MPRKRVAVTVGELESLIQSVTSETVAEIPFIAPAHAELREILEETRQLGRCHALRTLRAAFLEERPLPAIGPSATLR